jgi:hypothetical protein
VVPRAVSAAVGAMSRVRAAAVLGRRLGRALRLILGESLHGLGALRGVRVLLAVVALGHGLVVGDVAGRAADLWCERERRKRELEDE